MSNKPYFHPVHWISPTDTAWIQVVFSIYSLQIPSMKYRDMSNTHTQGGEMTHLWKRGDIFEQHLVQKDERLFGIVTGDGAGEKTPVMIIAFFTAEYSTTAFSPLIAEKGFLAGQCTLIESHWLPCALPAAVRPQLLSIQNALCDE